MDPVATQFPPWVLAQRGLFHGEVELKRVRQDFETSRTIVVGTFFQEQQSWPWELIGFLCDWLESLPGQLTRPEKSSLAWSDKSDKSDKDDRLLSNSNCCPYLLFQGPGDPTPVVAVLEGRDSHLLFKGLVIQHCQLHRPDYLLILDWNVPYYQKSYWPDCLPDAKEIKTFSELDQCILFILQKQIKWALANASNNDATSGGGGGGANNVVMVLDLTAACHVSVGHLTRYLSRWLNVAVFLHCPNARDQKPLVQGVDCVYMPLLGHDDVFGLPPSQPTITINYQWIQSTLKEWNVEGRGGASALSHWLQNVPDPIPFLKKREAQLTNRHALCIFYKPSSLLLVDSDREGTKRQKKPPTTTVLEDDNDQELGKRVVEIAIPPCGLRLHHWTEHPSYKSR